MYLYKYVYEVCNSYKAAALERGLLDDDQEIVECLSEGATRSLLVQLRELFVTILLFIEPAIPFALWNKYNQGRRMSFFEVSIFRVAQRKLLVNDSFDAKNDSGLVGQLFNLQFIDSMKVFQVFNYVSSHNTVLIAVYMCICIL